ncbi:hypothetical protein ABZ078_42140 [Streptomyces sp. NPDC006385]|uniref:hypothetical protein n=1 Tax=Streptomyces sp. NPDC006385 TaxID=3156761 RepID=UPI0033AF5D33
MNKLIVVVGPDGDIRAAAKINPRNTYSPIEIEVKSDQGESLHEVALPEELESEGLTELVNYQLAQGNDRQLVKRTH